MGASAAIPVLDDLMRHELLALLDAIGARCGYLALYGDDDAPGEPSWWIAQHLQPGVIAAVAARVSRGGTARALALGEVAEGTSSLCAAIGADPPCGLVFVETPAPVTSRQRMRFAAVLRGATTRLMRALSDEHARDPLAALRGHLCLDGVDGRSAALVAMLQDVAELAPRDVPVLVLGPTGAGKRRVARVLHDSSPFGRGPFVELHVEAICATAIDDVLWGSRAPGGRAGLLAMARGGTFHLDGYGSHDPAIEAKLSAVLTQRSVGCRIVASTRFATDASCPSTLLDALRDNVVTVPSLAERTGDVALLARTGLDTAVRHHGLAPMDISSAALRWLVAADWPGNVRSLLDCVERGAILAGAEPSSLVQLRHLTHDPQAPTLHDLPPDQRPTALARALVGSGWDVDGTARRLDLRRAELYRMIRDHGLAA
ncbi:MAG TPA: sigma 54-interacting transcriptional regulator [Candidatus Binatia bacterium]|nr:sigma 54-interacting transcriptional regulator [Candidatus Binatia bacterium]